jgi:hypothetical protein
MNPLVIGIEELHRSDLEELYQQVTAGREIMIRHRNGHLVKLLFAPDDPPIPNARRVIIGLHAGMMETAPDFCAPLPSEEWGGAFD